MASSPPPTDSSCSVICEVTGVLRDPQFHRCRFLLQQLSVLHPQFLPKLHGVMEREYLEFVHTNASTINACEPSDKLRATRMAQGHTEPFILVNQRLFLANEDALIAFIINKTRLSRSEILVAAAFGAEAIHSSSVIYAAVDAEERLQDKAEASAREALFRYRQVSGNDFAFLLIEIDGVTQPRIEIELFHDVCPKTCANFVALCQGTVPDISDEVRMLGYKGSFVHRIVHGGWIQAGDVTVVGEGDDIQPNSRGDGAPRSLYGREFPDESFAISHDQVGIVSMANANQPHTNGSQFFITLAPLPYLDRKKVAFGRVISGLTTIQRLGQLETVHERPCIPCKIVDAGRIVE